MTTQTIDAPPAEGRQERIYAGLEVRAADEGAELALSGRLVPYGIWAPIGGRWEERMARGVFAKSIKDAGRALPLLMLHDHHSVPIGKAVEWDDAVDGLHGRWVLADTDAAREAHRLADGEFMTGLSVGFQPEPKNDDWEFHEPPDLNRVTRRQARLLEASLVSVPTWAEAVVTHTRSSVAERMTLTPHRDAWSGWLADIR